MEDLGFWIFMSVVSVCITVLAAFLIVDIKATVILFSLLFSVVVMKLVKEF